MNKEAIDIEGWKQIGQIGRGGFGVVYVGKLRSGVCCAVKHVNLERYNLEELKLIKLYKEIDILSKLNNHPNIVK